MLMISVLNLKYENQGFSFRQDTNYSINPCGVGPWGFFFVAPSQMTAAIMPASLDAKQRKGREVQLGAEKLNTVNPAGGGKPNNQLPLSFVKKISYMINYIAYLPVL